MVFQSGDLRVGAINQMGFEVLWLLLGAFLVDGTGMPHESAVGRVQQISSSNNRIPVHLSAFELAAGKASGASSAQLGHHGIATPELVELLIRMIRHQMPESYHDERQWDQRKEVWNGVHIRLSGGKLETHRKKKEVRAGTWTRYSVHFVDPENRLHIGFDRLEPTSDGKMAFSTTVEADLNVEGQMSQWARNAKLYSISAQADASVKLTVEGTVQLKINPFKFPPEVTVIPHVEEAHLELISYRLRRVSHVGGDAAKLLGKSVRYWVDERLEKENERLPDRINRRLARRSHKMTFSAGDWLKSKRSSKKATAHAAPIFLRRSGLLALGQ